MKTLLIACIMRKTSVVQFKPWEEGEAPPGEEMAQLQ